MGLAEKMPEHRDLVWGILGEVALIGSTEIKGKFFKRYREIQMPDGSISALDLSFDCNVTAEVLALQEDDAVTINGTEYRFRRHVPIGGDESELVTLELKT